MSEEGAMNHIRSFERILHELDLPPGQCSRSKVCSSSPSPSPFPIHTDNCSRPLSLPGSPHTPVTPSNLDYADSMRRTVNMTRTFRQSRQTGRVAEGDIRYGARSAFAISSGSAVSIMWAVAAKGVVMPLNVLSGKKEELRELAEEEFVEQDREIRRLEANQARKRRTGTLIPPG
jgi:hypothetical protein